MRGKVRSTRAIFALSMVAVVLALGGIGQAAMGQKTAAPTSTTASVTLTEVEASYLVQMREEEKLARDVYITLSQKYADPVFAKIAESEQQHFAAIGTLIARYGVDDPATDDTVGSFTVPAFASLYAQLTEQGAASLTGAIEVGVAIETMDIADLGLALEATNRPDIKRVYSNLLQASLSHLQAFLSHL